MKKSTLSKISVAIVSILLPIIASNEHFGPTNSIFVYIESALGLIGIFVYIFITVSILYLVLSKLILHIDLTDSKIDVLTVVLVSSILIICIWSYIYFIFKPA